MSVVGFPSTFTLGLIQAYFYKFLVHTCVWVTLFPLLCGYLCQDYSGVFELLSVRYDFFHGKENQSTA